MTRLLGVEQAAALQGVLGLDCWRGRIEPLAARELFDWPRLNAALAEHRFDPARLSLSGAASAGGFRDRQGRVQPDKLTAALRNGATLILNAANEVSAPLRDICDGLAADFTCHSQANLYACWRQTRGFDVHWDDHDVIVVQAEGRKRWSLFGATREAPLVLGDPAAHRPPADPATEVVLEPGDVLYLPRGCWHAAVGLGEPSLHLTIGLTRRTGVDFLHWLADHLVEEAALRHDLPFEAGDEAVAARLAEVLQAAASQDMAGLAAAYRRHVESRTTSPAALSLPMIGAEETGFGMADRLSLTAGSARLEAAETDGGVVLSWRGTRLTLAAALRDLIERLIAGEAVAFADLLTCASRTQAEAFVRDMVGRGVLRVQPNA